MNDQLILEKWRGRLGNNIVQLCHSIYIAEQTQSRLKLLPHPGLLDTHDLDFTGGQPYQKTITNDFYWLDQDHLDVKPVASYSSRNIKFDVPPLDWNTRRRILRTYVKPMLQKSILPQVAEHGLVIHIRSGDIFRPKALTDKVKHPVHPHFVQPPLQFYSQIIKSQPWDKITIIAEDMANPCIEALLKTYSDIAFQAQDIESDIRALLTAETLVIGYGSFGIVWALLSQQLKSLYCPLLPINAFGRLYPGDIEGLSIQSFRFEDYIPIGQWKATQEQKDKMLTYKAPIRPVSKEERY